jgi:predicted transcriptional regulator
MDEPVNPDDTTLTADVVSAFVSHNSVRAADLPDLIASVHGALQGLKAPQQAEPEKREAPVSIKKSITPEFLISMEDGKRYKSLKRHLTGRGLTPEQYREKWGLPRDYPMVAPNYAKQRSELARASGLGQIRRGRAASGSDAAAQVESTPEPDKKARGRRKRTAEAA